MAVSNSKRKFKKKRPRIPELKGLIKHWEEDEQGQKYVDRTEQPCYGKAVYHATKGWRFRGSGGYSLAGHSKIIGFINKVITNE